jgi:hypothetical protein
MEWVILAIALLLMAPAAALPFLLSAQETMESDLRNKQPLVAPTRVRPVLHQQSNGPIEHRPAA